MFYIFHRCRTVCLSTILLIWVIGMAAQTLPRWEALKIGAGGQNLRLTFDPKDPDRIYLAIDVAGIAISDDGGGSWRNANSGLHGLVNGNYPAGDITVDPGDSNRLFASWGREYQNNSSVIVSTDRGNSWRQLSRDVCGYGEGKYARKAGGGPGILIDPRPAGRFYLIDNRHGQGAGGVWFSDDCGVTWRPSGLTGHWVKTIRFAPGCPDTIYAAALNHPSGPGGIWVSHDRGVNWILLGLSGKDVSNFDFDPANPALIYVVVGLDGFWRSADGGRTWLESNVGLPLARDGRKGRFFEYFYRALAVDPFRPGHLTISADVIQAFFESFDGGRTWQQLAVHAKAPEGWMLGEEHFGWRTNNIYYHPARPGWMYLCDYFGTWRSTDNGSNWTINPYGQESSCMVDILPDVEIFGRFYLGIWDHFLLIYQDDPARPYTERCAGLFKRVSVNKHISGLAQFASSPEHLLATANSSHFFKSSDRGRNWEEVTAGLPKKTDYRLGSPVVAAAANLALLPVNGAPASGGGLYLSSDFGKTWSHAANQGLGTVKLAGQWSSRSDALVVDADAKLILMATDGLLYRSVDRALTWSKLSVPSTALTVARGAEGMIILGTDRGLQLSRDDGHTWVETLSGWRIELLKADLVRPGRILCHSSRRNADGRIDYQLMYSADGGTSWIPLLNDSLPVWCLRGISFDPHRRNLILINTYWCGSWKMVLPAGR